VLIKGELSSNVAKRAKTTYIPVIYGTYTIVIVCPIDLHIS